MKVICFYKPKSFLFSESLANCPQKPHFCTNLKLFFCTNLSSLSSKISHFHKPKAFYFAQTFPYHHSKQSFSTLHLPFAPSHNLLFAKNTVILSISALTPYAVTPERRTDSKPFRRRLVRKTGFGSCRRKFLQKYFRQSFESSPGVQRVATLWGTPRSFRTSEKNKTVSLSGKLRGSANLKSAHHNNDFARTKLKPYPKGASRFCKPRISKQPRYFKTVPTVSDIHTIPPVARTRADVPFFRTSFSLYSERMILWQETVIDYRETKKAKTKK